MPRQLAIEALDSIFKILFPPDPESQSFLSSLVSRNSFDEDCLRFEPIAYRSDDEKDISFNYFGSRLVDLYDELENPTARGWLQKWLERKSGARYVMMATLIGVMMAVVLGILGLAVGTFSSLGQLPAVEAPHKRLIFQIRPLVDQRGRILGINLLKISQC